MELRSILGKINSNGMVQLPKSLMALLEVEEGDAVEFSINGANNTILISKHELTRGERLEQLFTELNEVLKSADEEISVQGSSIAYKLEKEVADLLYECDEEDDYHYEDEDF